MTIPGPTVLFWLASSVEQTRCQRRLLEDSTWQGQVMGWGEETTAAASSDELGAAIAPDVIVTDYPRDGLPPVSWSGQTTAAPARVWLLEDGSLPPMLETESGTVQDYLFKSQLHGPRLSWTIRNLWQQRQLQQQLMNCQRQGVVFGQNGVGINQADPSGRFTRVNQRFCELLGYAEAELLQLTYQELTHPDDLAAQVEMERQLFAGAIASHTFEKRYLAKDGHPVWTRVTLSAIYDANNCLVGDLAIIEDIDMRVSLEAQYNQTELDLRNQRNLLRTFLDSLPHIAWIKDENGRFLTTNAAFAESCGLSPEALEGKTDLDIWPQELAEAYRADDCAVMASRQQQRVEEPLVAADGSRQWIDTIKTPFFGENGEVLGTVGIAIDVTDRKQAEASLQENRDFLQAMVDSLPVSLFVKDARPDHFGEFVLVNPLCEQFLGLQRDHILGQTDYDLFSAEQAESFVQTDRQIMVDRQKVELEEVLERPHRGTQILQTLKVPIYDADQQPRYLLGISQDVTAQKQAKADLLQSETRLTEAQKLAHLGNWEYAPATGQLIWSQELLRQYGFDESIAGPSFEEFVARIHPDDWPAVEQAIEALMTDGTPYAIHHRIVRPDGTVRHTFCKGQAVLDDQGQVIKAMGVSQDVTETRNTEQALQASEARYRYLVENLPNGAVQALDQNFNITFLGGQSLQTLGLNTEDVIGRHASEILSPEDWATVEPLLQQTQAGQPAQWEMSFGGYEFLFSTTPLYAPDGEIEGVLCISQDITNRKQAEEALRRSEQKQRALVEALPDLIIRMSGDGVYLDFFAASNFQVIGSTDNLIGQDVYSFGLPYELAEMRMGYIQQALTTSALQVYEQTLFNGEETVTEEVRIVPAGDNEVLIIVRDVTEQARLEAERQQAEAELRASQKFVQQITDSSPNVIYIYDIAEQRNVFVNRAVYTFLGYTQTEIMGRTDGTAVNLMHPDDLDRARDYFANLSTLPDEEFAEFEYRMQHKNGEWRWFFSRDRVFKRDAAGQVTQILGNAQDITLLKKSELALQQANAEMQAIFEASPDLLFRVDGESTMLDCKAGRHNPDFYLPPEELLGQKIPAVLPQDVSTRFGEAIQQTLATQALVTFEYQLPIAGKVQDFEARLVPFQPQQAIVTVRNISDRKQAERALQTSEARYRQLIDNIPNGAAQTLDKDLRITYVGGQILSQLGVTPAQLIGTSPVEYIAPADQAAFDSAMQQALQGESTLVASAHGDHQFLVSFAPLYNPAGETEGLISVTQDITALKQAELALRESERRYATLTENSPIGIFRFDAAGECVYVNPRWCEMTGRTLETASGDDWVNLLHPDDRDRLLGGWAVALEQQMPYANEGRHIHTNGTVVWSDLRMMPEFDDQGELLGYVGTVSDISDRKQAELALRDSEQRFATLAESAPVGIFRFDATGQLLYVNPAWCQMTGYTLEAAGGDSWVNVLHPDDRDRLLNLWTEALPQRIPYQTEGRGLHADGSIVWFDLRMMPEFDAEGQFQGYIGTVADITSNKAAEAALQESETRFRQLAETVHEGFFVFETAIQQYSYVNPACTAITEIDFSQHHDSQWLDWVHPDDRERVARAKRELDAQNFDEEYRFVKTNGDVCWLRSQAFPIQDAEGTVVRIVGTVEDISDRKQAQLALEASEERLRLAMSAAKMGSWDWDIVADQIIWSETLERMMGLESGAFDGNIESVAALIHPADRSQVMAAIQHSLEGDADYEVEFRFVKPDGAIRWALSKGQVLRDAEGRPLRMTGVDVDISDRKTAEMALRQANQHMEAIFAAFPDLLFQLRADGTIQNYQARSDEHLYTTPEHFIGHKVQDILPPEAGQLIYRGIQQALASGAVVSVEYQLPMGDQVQFFDARIVALDETTLISIARDISARKQAEMALQASEHRYASLAENSPNAVFRLDAEGHCVYINPRWCEMTGRTVEQGYGDDWIQVLHPDDRDWLVADLQAAIAQQKYLRNQGRHLLPDGSVIWFDAQIVPEQDDQGNFLGFIGTLVDITDRKQAELALQQLNEELEQRVQERTAALTRSEQDLRTIFNNVYDSIYIHDLDGTILDVNDRTLELHGATREQLVGASVADISSPDAPVSELSDIFQRVQQGETLQFEWVGRRFDDDHTFDVEVSLRQVTLDQQTVVIAGVRDISDRKRAAQELQAERFRLQLALDAADMGTWSCQLAPQQLQWSVKAEEIFGFQQGTFSGDRDTFIEMIHPEDRDRVLHAIEQTFETGAPYQIEYRIGRLDGESRWVAVWGMISPSTESAEQQQLIGVVADITDRKQAELDLRESRNMLELVLNAIPQRVFWKDRHLVYRGGNLAYANDYQLTAADINGKVDTDFFSAEQAQLYAEEDQRILSGISRKLDYEEQLDITTGEQRWLQTSKVPLTNSQGEVVGVLGCYDDISDRKRAEAALHDSEERLRLALMASNQGLYDLDLITGESIVSPTYVTMLGYNPANFHETPAKWLQRMHPDDRERVGSVYRAYVAGEMPDYKVEFRQRMQNGTYKWILSVGKIVSRDEDGTPLRLIGTHTDIHERKQAEEELQLLASVVENSSDFVGVATIDGNAKYVNPAGQQLVGLANLAAVLETTMFDYFPPTDHDLFCQQVIPTIDAQGTWKGELNFQHFQTGQTIQTEFNGFLVRHPETQAPLYYAGIARDITDRKQAEAALRESEERFRQIANNISEVFWLATPDHEILYASPAYEQVWGHPATPLNAETWLETVYPADRERLLAQVDETLPQYPAGLLHANSELEYRIVRPDGEIRWIRDRAFPVYDDQGNLYRIAGVAEDITDRKHLQQEQQRLLSLLEASPDHIGVAYPDGTLIWTNQQAKYLRGLPPDTDVTQLSLDIFHPHWAQVVIQQEAIPKALAGEIWMGETALLTADGSEIPVSQLVWANRSETGEVEHLFTIMRDISDLKRAEQALREANTDLETRVAERTAELVEACDAAETANQAKSIFLANMSHELRTPLNAILGFSQLMGRDQALSTQHLEELKIINRSGEHLLTLINDILEMSKIEAGQATLNPAQFDLAQLLNSLVDMLRLKAESKGLSLSLAIAPDLPQYICTDGHKLRQVLLNLLSNALKFTQAGYVTLRVVPADLADLPPTSRQSQNLTTDASTLVALRFEIEDSGAGIAAEELDLLFEPFAQTASGRLSQEGTGLGLPISYQFVQLMGGDLTVSSQPDVGSTFAFTIPVQVVDATAIEALAGQRRVIGLAPDQPDYRILIVEDNWANRVLLQNLLTGLGFTVKTAVHGQAAIYCWQSWQPHLIFMDIRMPVMNGCEATQEIRHQEQWLQEQGMITTTKIISLTAGVFADTQGDFAEIGFDGFIRKPIKEQDITDTIAQQLAVEYLYEAETVASLEFEPAAIVHLTAEGLQDLPADWLAQFHDALLQLNQTEMLTLINHLPPEQAAVAGALHRKVQDFDFEVLLDLLQSR